MPDPNGVSDRVWGGLNGSPWTDESRETGGTPALEYLKVEMCMEGVSEGGARHPPAAWKDRLRLGKTLPWMPRSRPLFLRGRHQDGCQSLFLTLALFEPRGLISQNVDLNINVGYLVWGARSTIDNLSDPQTEIYIISASGWPANTKSGPLQFTELS